MQGGITTTLLIGLPPLPAPPPLVNALQRIEIEASTDVASAFRLRFGLTQSAGLDWDLVGPQYEETLFRPFMPVQIRVKIGIEIPETIINGYISGQQVLYDDDGGGSALEITGMDATMLMNLQEKVMPWPILPDAQIAQAIFAQYLITPLVVPDLAEPDRAGGHDHPARHRHPLPAPAGAAQRLRVFRRSRSRRPASTSAISGRRRITRGPPKPVLNVRMGTDTNVSDFEIRYDMTRPTTAIGMGIDVKTRAPAVFPRSFRRPPPPVAGSIRSACRWARACRAAFLRAAVPADGLSGRDRPILAAGLEYGGAGHRRPLVLGGRRGGHGRARCRRAASGQHRQRPRRRPVLQRLLIT